jgi:hypothetical protein
MTLPTTMTALIDHYAEEGNKDALLGIRAAQAAQLLDLELTKFDPDKIDRSWSMKQFGDYYRSNIAHIDKALASI